MSDCMTSQGMGYMCKVEETMIQALYLSILQYGVMKTIERYRCNPPLVIFQHDNNPKHTMKLIMMWVSMQNYIYILA